MRKTLRIIVIGLLLAICGSTPVLAGGGSPVPLCYPKPCPVQ